MIQPSQETCPDCGAILPAVDGPTHRYIGASPSCWALFSALHSGGQPPLASFPTRALIPDAYAAQHPGGPSDQAIQSVAVHLIALHGVLDRDVDVANVLWLRTRPLRAGSSHKHERFHWLTPPSFAGSLTVADVARASTPPERAAVAARWIEQVWARWAQAHAETVANWYERYVVAERI